ncbi:hypothetical protein B0H16DRAFT_1471461 [Mycena metata]|uniref:Uncharacterized protein n=1 Tax=Mycena metata TaxID=1033252 RepID=A0AAD7HRS2_9AGAR|nr:hypothetical protein B0H16DRAFT_1471461 [Mycena metata]
MLGAGRRELGKAEARSIDSCLRGWPRRVDPVLILRAACWGGFVQRRDVCAWGWEEETCARPGQGVVGTCGGGGGACGGEDVGLGSTHRACCADVHAHHVEYVGSVGSNVRGCVEFACTLAPGSGALTLSASVCACGVVGVALGVDESGRVRQMHTSLSHRLSVQARGRCADAAAADGRIFAASVVCVEKGSLALSTSASRLWGEGAHGRPCTTASRGTSSSKTCPRVTELKAAYDARVHEGEAGGGLAHDAGGRYARWAWRRRWQLWEAGARIPPAPHAAPAEPEGQESAGDELGLDAGAHRAGAQHRGALDWLSGREGGRLPRRLRAVLALGCALEEGIAIGVSDPNPEAKRRPTAGKGKPKTQSIADAEGEGEGGEVEVGAGLLDLVDRDVHGAVGAGVSAVCGGARGGAAGVAGSRASEGLTERWDLLTWWLSLTSNEELGRKKMSMRKGTQRELHIHYGLSGWHGHWVIICQDFECENVTEAPK